MNPTRTDIVNRQSNTKPQLRLDLKPALDYYSLATSQEAGQDLPPICHAIIATREHISIAPLGGTRVRIRAFSALSCAEDKGLC